mmetsp:Transcript_11487/g.24622  ORF Transcript_11487/g.24622 Transcript_11487/m.24622 type:complete len:393 (-) Transcript_11487:203-1381(-)
MAGRLDGKGQGQWLSRHLEAWDTRESTRPSRCRRFPTSLTKRIYLFAFVTGQQSSLLGHWLTHYSRLGLDFSQRSYIMLHNATEDTAGSMAELERSRALLYSFAGTNAVHESHIWSSALKSDGANAYMASLPPDSMLVYPDMDEFFEFECVQLEKIAASALPIAIVSQMEDRLAADFQLRSVLPDVRLTRQFPLRCSVVQLCLAAKSKKYTLVPVRDGDGKYLQYHLAHDIQCHTKPMDPAAGTVKNPATQLIELEGCSKLTVQQGPPLRHYHFTAQTVNFTEGKIRQYARQHAETIAKNNLPFEHHTNAYTKTKKYATEVEQLFQRSHDGNSYLGEWCRDACNETLIEATAGRRVYRNKTTGMIVCDGEDIFKTPKLLTSSTVLSYLSRYK